MSGGRYISEKFSEQAESRGIRVIAINIMQ